jgi:putative flippase GtrA
MVDRGLKFSDLFQMVNFCLVGLVSTVFTLAIIYALMFFGSGLVLANFSGYVLGIVLNFFLNSRLTFKKEISIRLFYRFLLACLIAYVINLVGVLSIVAWMPERAYLAQLAGMLLYTTANFLLNRFWAMT